MFLRTLAVFLLLFTAAQADTRLSWASIWTDNSGADVVVTKYEVFKDGELLLEVPHNNGTTTQSVTFDEPGTHVWTVRAIAADGTPGDTSADVTHTQASGVPAAPVVTATNVP